MQDLGDKAPIPQYKLWEKIIFFFPVQLLFVHLKKNLILLFSWLLLFAIITKTISLKYGVPYLFLFPEYLGEVNFLSHLIMGLITGAFIMAFNISSYVVNGFRFPFLATLNRPFIKYCQNNFIIPLNYSVVYIISLAAFQFKFESVAPAQIIINILGFIVGNVLFIFLTFSYFMATNKNLFSFIPEKQIQPGGRFINPVNDLFSSNKKWRREYHGTSRKEWKVTAYISAWGRLKIARDSGHYNRDMLEKVFSQNRINASVFQAIILISLFIIGWFNDVRWFTIPAAGSVLLFFTMLIMLASAFYSWFKGWTSLVLLSILIAMNFLSTKSSVIYRNQAYGLNYDTTQAEYSQSAIRRLQSNNQNLYLDVENGVDLLENWKAKTGEEKPVAVFLNVPGGGLRSATWTMRSISDANKRTGGELWKNLLFISGSSGGMIGAAYLREYYYRTEYEGVKLPIDSAIQDMAKDKLNPVAATAVLNDLFFRFKTFEYEGNRYTKDRALSFENKLNLDTRGWMNRDLSFYSKHELSGEMPMMVLAPTISQDGRKLLISSQPIAYLCHISDSAELNENIEFSRFFKDQGAGNLNFVSALRMSATFPYVFPAANLPTNPGIEILDAGIRDNYGMSNTLKFIYFFRDWLAQNTSQIIIIQVRDQQKFKDIDANKEPSMLEGITQPFGTFYNTILDVQDYQMDDQVRLIKDWYKSKITVVEFVLERSESNPISLSWHLTEKEKERIMNAIETPHNLSEASRMNKILNPELQKKTIVREPRTKL
jgi:hypothetical protein